ILTFIKVKLQRGKTLNTYVIKRSFRRSKPFPNKSSIVRLSDMCCERRCMSVRIENENLCVSCAFFLLVYFGETNRIDTTLKLLRLLKQETHYERTTRYTTAQHGTSHFALY
ncbi:hypothetical protein V1477_007988, partial [Vespula maculifrons]